MPTYEYECKKCGKRFEKFQKMTDPPLKKCPECKGEVKRIITSGGAVIFKGKGFYQTDYKNTKSKDSKEGPAPCGKNDKCPSCDQ